MINFFLNRNHIYNKISLNEFITNDIDDNLQPVLFMIFKTISVKLDIPDIRETKNDDSVNKTYA